MNRALGLCFCALLPSCKPAVQHKDEPRITDQRRLARLREAFVPEAYLRPEDQAKAARLRDGYSGPMPCEYEKMEGGARVIASPPVDQCFKMSKPQHWQGLWRNNFEGSQFCAAPADRCPTDNQNDYVWLNIAAALPGAEDTPPGGLYAIDFVGRKTAYRAMYGGGASYEVIIDHLTSIKMIEPPPPGQMTKEHIAAYSKECAGKPICMPNSEVPKK